MPITTDFEIFILRCVENGATGVWEDNNKCETCEVNQQIPFSEYCQKCIDEWNEENEEEEDDKDNRICKMINTEETKKNKEKFNIVMREIFSVSLEGQDDIEAMMNEVIYPTIQENEWSERYTGMYEIDSGMSILYTKDLILSYKSVSDCVRGVNGFNKWDLSTNTADM